jgi:hypothetical protein
MQAYTYSILRLSTGQWYYGVRKSITFDLGTTYFSSSMLVKRLIQEEGVANFEFKLRRTFESYNDAGHYETAFLKRVRAVSNLKFLNQGIGFPASPTKDPESEKRRRSNISATMITKWADSEFALTNKFNKADPVELSKRGKMGSTERTKRYSSGILVRKPKTTSKYPDVVITRGSVEKIVKANQVPQYKKLGWSRVGSP